MGLPGDIRKLRFGEVEGCDFVLSSYGETIMEMVESGIGSDDFLKVVNNKEPTCTCRAVYSIQGETDSFGAEYHYYCEQHYKVVKEIHQFVKTKRSSMGETQSCDLCKHDTPIGEIKPIRDYDEGMNGPVYYACPSCRDKLRDYNSQD